MFTYSLKRPVREFHFVVVHWLQRNVQKGVLHVPCTCSIKATTTLHQTNFRPEENSCVFKSVPFSHWSTPVRKFRGHAVQIKVASERSQNIEQSRVSQGCLPFTKSFRKIRLGSKWNSTFWVIPAENLRGSNGTSEKIVLFFFLFSDGMVQKEIRVQVPLLQRHLWYQFQAFAFFSR